MSLKIVQLTNEPLEENENRNHSASEDIENPHLDSQIHRLLEEVRIQKEMSQKCTFILKIKQVIFKDCDIPQELWMTSMLCKFDIIEARETKGENFSMQHIKIMSSCIALAIEHLQNHNIIHGDIKCRNVLLSEFGDVKLTDFGEAIRLPSKDSLLKTTKRFGTDGFIAPELYHEYLRDGDSHEFGLKTDLWSFGCTLVEMLKGESPISNGIERIYHRDRTTFSNLEKWCVYMFNTKTKKLNKENANRIYIYCELNSLKNLTEDERSIIESEYRYKRIDPPNYKWPEKDAEEYESLHDLARECILPSEFRAGIDEVLNHEFLRETVHQLKNDPNNFREEVMNLVQQIPATEWSDWEQDALSHVKKGRFGFEEPFRLRFD